LLAGFLERQAIAQHDERNHVAMLVTAKTLPTTVNDVHAERATALAPMGRADIAVTGGPAFRVRPPQLCPFAFVELPRRLEIFFLEPKPNLANPQRRIPGGVDGH
jgi:hypothetical protein